MKQAGLAMVITLVLSSPVLAEAMKQDNVQVRDWNTFAHNVHKLHKKLIKDVDVRIEKRQGGYSYLKEWHYQEEKFVNKKNGQVISLIQWDSSKKNQLHTIEVYIYDQQGRVVRDYMAAYLPNYHNAPTQTLISLHRYNKKLHAFRTFDASGDRIVERCQGIHRGKPVEMLLDEDEIAELQHEKDSIMKSAVYKECFADLQTEAGDYLLPQ